MLDNMEKEIEFYIDGEKCGSGTLFFENGELDTTNAEDCFWKAVRFDKQTLIAEEFEHIMEHLTKEQEEKLKEAHMNQYRGTDDDAPDDFDNWLTELDLDQLKAILK